MIPMKFFPALAALIVTKEPCSASLLSTEKNIFEDLWLPRELGRFHLKDAAFVEVYEITPPPQIHYKNETVYADKYNLFITTFNACKIQKQKIL